MTQTVTVTVTRDTCYEIPVDGHFNADVAIDIGYDLFARGALERHAKDINEETTNVHICVETPEGLYEREF
jgi:hypothetical protein